MAASYSIQYWHRVSPVSILNAPEAWASEACLLMSPRPSISMLDEAKRWFEVSTVICRFVPEGKMRAEKVSMWNHSPLPCSFYDS